MNVKKTIGVIAFFFLMGSIFAANWFISHIGVFCQENGPCVIPVFPDFQGAWVMAPSGVIWIGLSLFARDLVQRGLGLRWAIVSVLVGAILSAWLNPFLAAASGLAFLLSEFLDLAVYTPLQSKNLVLAVVASNGVGLIIDSIVFLTIAFGSLAFIEGQIIGKALMIIPAVILIKGIRWMEDRYLEPEYAFNS